MEASPIGQYKDDRVPDQIRCRTPKWNQTDTANVEVSVNGQDFIGGFQIQFVDRLSVYRISPMAGPIGGATKVKLFGSGLNSAQDTPVFVKFGTISVDTVAKDQVESIDWNDEAFHEDFNIPKSLLTDAEEHDPVLDEGQPVKKFVAASSPDISAAYGVERPDTAGLGGPVFVQVGEKVPI